MCYLSLPNSTSSWSWRLPSPQRDEAPSQPLALRVPFAATKRNMNDTPGREAGYSVLGSVLYPDAAEASALKSVEGKLAERA